MDEYGKNFSKTLDRFNEELSKGIQKNDENVQAQGAYWYGKGDHDALVLLEEENLIKGDSAVFHRRTISDVEELLKDLKKKEHTNER